MFLPNQYRDLSVFTLLRLSLLPLLVLAAGIYLSAQAEQRQQAINQQKSQAELQRRLVRLSATVIDRITLYQYGLRGVRGAIVSVGAQQYRLDNMQQYAQSRDISLEFPGARGFGFIRKVPAAELPTFLQQASIDRGEPFVLQQLQPHQNDLFIIQYVEPYQRNKAAVGLDIGSDPSRRQAALLAATNNAPTLTAPITLVQQSEKTGQGFLFLLPVYQGTVSADPSSRYQQVLGWSYAPLLIDEILRPLADIDPDLQLRITDLAAGTAFFQLPAATGGSTDVVATKKIALFGRNWLIEATASPHFIASLNLPEPDEWLRYGLLVSLLSMLLSLLLQLLWLRRQHLNQQKSLLTAIVVNANEAIIGLDHQGQVLSWNPAAADLFGYSEAESLGKTLAELIVPPEQQEQEAWILNQLMAGYNIHGLDTVRQNRQGQPIVVSINASPIDVSRHDVTGFAMTIHDIRQLKAAELMVRQHNQQLEAEVLARTAEIVRVSALQRSMLNSTHYAVIATDVAGTITAFNPAAELLLGYQATELIGQASPQLFHDAAEIRQRAKQLSAELGQRIEAGFAVFIAKVSPGQADAFQWHYVHKAGHRILVNLTITALLDEQQVVTGYLGVADDLTRQQQLEFELALAKVSTEQTLDLVLWLTQDGRVLKANTAMAMALGYSDQQLLKLDISQLLADYDASDWQQQLALLCHSASLRLQQAYRCFDGQTLPVSLTMAQIDLAEQSYIYLVGRDISQQLAKEKELAQAKELAEAANQAKSTFLNNISYEIRTPIEQLLQQLQHLQHSGLTSRQLQYLTATSTACSRLTSLLQDIADFSSVETGRVQLDLQRLELSALLQRIKQELQPELTLADLELVFDIASQVPAEVLADSQRLAQVLLNLTLHALKSARIGTVILRIERVAQALPQVLLQFSLSFQQNSSIAATESLQASVLSPLPPLPPAPTSDNQGLGLALCQRLVELMGGQIQFQPTAGSNSCFFQLWLTQLDDPAVVRPQAPAVGNALLLVEPCAESATVLLRQAEYLGYQPELASNAEQACRLIASDASRFALILLNWRLPELDGCQLAAKLKQQQPALCCPIILLATPFQRSALSRYWQDGAQPAVDTVLVKPCYGRSFYLMLQDALQAPLCAKPDPALAVTGRLSGLRLLLLDENPCYRHLGAALLQHEGCTVVTAATGQQALAELAGSLLPFDLLLLDLTLPDQDGFAVAASIRQQAPYRTLPLVAISVQPSLADKLASLAGGLDEHVVKPFDIHALVQVIIRLTSRQQRQLLPVAVSGSSLSVSLQTFCRQQQIQLDTAIQRLGNSLLVYHKTVQIFCTELQQQLHWLQSAAAISLPLADLHWCCGKLRSTAAVLGLTELMQILANYEKQSQAPDEPSLQALRQTLVHWQDLLQQLLRLTNVTKIIAAELPQPQLLQAELQALAAELVAADMHAVARFALLQRQLALQDAVSTALLDKLINQLDFVAAVEIVQTLLEQLQRETCEQTS